MRPWRTPSEAYIEAMSRVGWRRVEWGATKDMEPYEITRALRDSFGPETARKMEAAKSMAGDDGDDEPLSEHNRGGIPKPPLDILGFDPENAPYFDGDEYVPYNDRGELLRYPPLNVSIPEPQPPDPSLLDSTDDPPESSEQIRKAKPPLVQRRQQLREGFVKRLIERMDELLDDDEFDPGPDPSIAFDSVRQKDDLRHRIRNFSENDHQTMTDTLQEPSYNYLPPRYPDDRPVHRVKYDRRTYYFKEYSGSARLTRYEKPDGNTLVRLDAVDMDDIADPVLDILRENGVSVE